MEYRTKINKHKTNRIYRRKKKVGFFLFFRFIVLLLSLKILIKINFCFLGFMLNIYKHEVYITLKIASGFFLTAFFSSSSLRVKWWYGAWRGWGEGGGREGGQFSAIKLAFVSYQAYMF
jgi:hypothetical protein